MEGWRGNSIIEEEVGGNFGELFGSGGMEIGFGRLVRY